MGKEIKFFTTLTLIGLFLTLAISCKKDDTPKEDVTPKQGEPITDIDGNIYQTIYIGDQLWMKSNLNVSRYRNGESIPNITDETQWAKTTTGAYCYCNNEDSFASVYGKLYNFHTVIDERKLCPDGWHIPSESEWATLIDYLGENNAGTKLKDPYSNLWKPSSNNTKHPSGFDALPAGLRFFYNQFRSIGYSTYFWSSTEDGELAARFRGVVYDSDIAIDDFAHKNLGFSVRCLKD